MSGDDADEAATGFDEHAFDGLDGLGAVGDGGVVYLDCALLNPPRVLVIDDERFIRGLLAELLTVWGCEADVAANGTEGLALLDLKSYDLVLTDYVMPGSTGVELVERVRSRDQGIGVIMLTGSEADLESDGLIERTPDGFSVTEVGRLLIRNIAMRFDVYLPAEKERRFSKTI